MWLRREQLSFDRTTKTYRKVHPFVACSQGSALMTIYPEYTWKPWNFVYTPRGYFDTMENQKEFFDWLGNTLNITKLDDWYNIKTTDILRYVECDQAVTDL